MVLITCIGPKDISGLTLYVNFPPAAALLSGGYT